MTSSYFIFVLQEQSPALPSTIFFPDNVGAGLERSGQIKHTSIWRLSTNKSGGPGDRVATLDATRVCSGVQMGLTFEFSCPGIISQNKKDLSTILG